jgi:type VII secretion protein EccB
MRSRRDQVQAHAYVVGRLTSALVHAEPDAPESPLRRTGLGSFGGLLVGALILAGFMIWGLIRPATPASALTAGELLLVKETGSRFIYAGNELHPVLNWSSALMLTGGKATITTVSQATLNSIPQGQPLGILGAPDQLPAAGSLNTGAWLACSQSGRGAPLVSLSIGPPPPLSRPSADDAVLVATPEAEYLLWRGTRLRLDAPTIVDALGLNNAPVIKVAPAWLNAVPAGPDLRPLSVPGAGRPGPVLGGLHTRVGQVLVVRNVGSQSQLYVVGPDEVAPITATQAAVLLTDRGESAAYPGGTAAPVTVSPAAIADASTLPSGLADKTAVPSAPPHGYHPAAAAVPCADYSASGAAAPQLVFAVPPAGQPPAVGTPGVTASPQGAALISVAPDDGALVRPEIAPGSGGTSLFLVTDTGVKYALPATEAAALGYRAGQAAALPAALLGLLPTGPALDLPALRG